MVLHLIILPDQRVSQIRHKDVFHQKEIYPLSEPNFLQVRKGRRFRLTRVIPSKKGGYLK